jgi:hypothetical protein
MPKQRYCAKSVFDSPAYSQGVKVSGPGTYRQDLVPIREEFFGPKLPASTLIATPSLAHPDYLLEIEAVAFVEGR